MTLCLIWQTCTGPVIIIIHSEITYAGESKKCRNISESGDFFHNCPFNCNVSQRYLKENHPYCPFFSLIVLTDRWRIIYLIQHIQHFGLPQYTSIVLQKLLKHISGPLCCTGWLPLKPWIWHCSLLHTRQILALGEVIKMKAYFIALVMLWLGSISYRMQAVGISLYSPPLPLPIYNHLQIPLHNAKQQQPPS